MNRRVERECQEKSSKNKDEGMGSLTYRSKEKNRKEYKRQDPNNRPICDRKFYLIRRILLPEFQHTTYYALSRIRVQLITRQGALQVANNARRAVASYQHRIG